MITELKRLSFFDGPKIDEINSQSPTNIDGYTFNQVYSGKIMQKII